MRHGYFGKKLSRTKNERRQLFVGLVRELIDHGSIRTTVTKAKAVQPMVEKLITKAKRADKKGDRAYRLIFKVVGDKKTTQKLLGDAQTRFGNRTSGFTQIIKLGMRSGDASEAVLFQFIDQPVAVTVIKPKVEKPITKEKKAVPRKKRMVKKTK